MNVWRSSWDEIRWDWIDDSRPSEWANPPVGRIESSNCHWLHCRTEGSTLLDFSLSLSVSIFILTSSSSSTMYQSVQ